jgi:hypothetical protein
MAKRMDELNKRENYKKLLPGLKKLKMKINVTQNFTAMVTGHGKTNSYLHGFKIIKTPTRPCVNSDQTVDHLLLDCQLLNKERNLLKQSVQKTNWPTNKRELIEKHIKDFMKFTNEIHLDEINVEQNSRKQTVR